MNLIKNISIVAIASFLSVLVAELLLSFLNPIDLRSDPKWVADGYTRGHYKPNQVIEGSIGHNVRNPNWRREMAKYKLNNFGYKGDNWDPKKSNGIAFYGGSSTFSFHDNEINSWPFMTTKCLNSTGTLGYQTLNYSHPGYSIFDAPHLLLQKGQHFKADWIITYHLWNDIKFIKAVAADPNFLLNTSVAESSTTIKSIILDLKLLHNLVGNINVAYKKFARDKNENSYEGLTKKKIENKDIDLGLSMIRNNYLSMINLSQKNQKFLFIKQGLLLDRGNPLHDREIDYELIGLDKAQFLETQKKYGLMLDQIATDFSNVYVFDADAVIPKNLEMYEDHVHLQPQAQVLLAKSVCDYLKSVNF